MKDLSGIILASLLLILFNGCNLDELEFDKVSNKSVLHPTFIAPLAKGNITVWDLVNAANNENGNNLSKDSTGLISIIYKQKDLFTYNVHDLFDFPEDKSFSSKDQVLGDLYFENINIYRAITLNELAGQMNGTMNEVVALNGQNAPFPEVLAPNMDGRYPLQQISDFNTITLSQGTLKVTLENNLNVPISVTGSFFDITNNTTVSEFTFTNVAPGATRTSSYNVAGKELSNNVEFRVLSFETPGTSTAVYINTEDYFTVNFDLTDLGVSKGNLYIHEARTLKGSTDNFEFDFPESDLKAFGAVLNKGSLTVKTINSLPMNGTVNLVLSEIKNKVTGLPVTASVPLSGTSTVISIDNTIINFASDPEKAYNRIPYTYTMTVYQTNGYINYSAGDAVQLEVTLDKLEFQSVTGDFGKRTIEVDPGKFDLQVDLLDKIDGSFKLVNPNLVLSVHNSMGIPATMSLDFLASNKAGSQVSLAPPSFELPVPLSLQSGQVTKNIAFNKQNSNIVDFIALPPSGDISYTGKVEFNPTNTVNLQNANFMDIDATFGIDMAVELPMQLQIKNLGFKDTTSIDGSSFEKVESAELILNAMNGIPLDIDMQLLFIDTITGHQYGATNVTRILSAARVNATDQITAVQSSHSFQLDKVEIENLKKANGIVFSGLVSSPGDGAQVASFLSESQIDMKLAIKAKVNL